MIKVDNSAWRARVLDATAALTGEGGWGPGAAVARTYAPMAGSGTCVPDFVEVK
jgi:hypothetical protein